MAKSNNHFKKFYYNEKTPDDYQSVQKEQLKNGKIRRRLEDIQEGLRLNREVFADFPDMPK